MLLEACVDSVESAIAAERGGADRLELCSALIIGGQSPTPALFDEVRQRVNLPIRVMVRPRFGDFLYSENEFAVMLKEAETWRERGADGIVMGILKPDGELDTARMRVIVQATPNVGYTLHRAFDLCKDPYEALESAIETGFDTVLTSGQAESCIKGATLLRRLNAQAAGRATILGGAGINASVIPELYAATGITCYHASGKTRLQSRMAFRREGVPMGLPGFSEFEIWQTDAENIRRIKQAMEATISG